MFIQNLQYKLHKLNTAQIITLSFAGVIFVGGLILWLPLCTAPGQTTSFSDAMFTATTCVCVTGLVTVVTATHWSLIGKLVILLADTDWRNWFDCAGKCDFHLFK